MPNNEQSLIPSDRDYRKLEKKYEKATQADTKANRFAMPARIHAGAATISTILPPLLIALNTMNNGSRCLTTLLTAAEPIIVGWYLVAKRNRKAALQTQKELTVETKESLNVARMQLEQAGELRAGFSLLPEDIGKIHEIYRPGVGPEIVFFTESTNRVRKSHHLSAEDPGGDVSLR